jgi:hypothetical protein
MITPAPLVLLHFRPIGGAAALDIEDFAAASTDDGVLPPADLYDLPDLIISTVALILLDPAVLRSSTSRHLLLFLLTSVPTNSTDPLGLEP